MAKEQWRIQLFGNLQVRVAGRLVTHFESRKTGALLACLALRPGRPHPREVLAEQLWPEEDADTTRSRLRQSLFALRRDLEPDVAIEDSPLLADRIDVRLDAGAVTVDVAEFEAALAAAGRAPEAAEQVRLLQQAVDLYQGELLPGYYEDWLVAERERLAEMFRNTLGRLATSLAAAGDLTAAIEVGRHFVAADPLREDAHCGLMRLYAAAGRTPEAIRQFRELERVLRQEVDEPPAAATRALLQQLRAGAAEQRGSGEVGERESSEEHRPAAAAPPPLLHSSTPRAGKPAPLEPEGGAVALDSPFYIVRPADLQCHAALDRGDSIVLVKGPRQTGKTSLLARGLQAARDSGARVVMSDLQKLAPEQMESPAALFETLAAMITDQLDLEVSPQAVRIPQRGWNVNFERFLRREVLGKLMSGGEGALVWGLDEVDRLFSCPFHNVVFGLFRSWHNERALDPEGPWGRLTLAIAYATEAHLFITDLNQSPFNVGTRLELEDFSPAELAELNRRYGSPLPDEGALKRLHALVGGHPYLARRALHALAEDGLRLPDLQTMAGRGAGIFSDHLRRLLASLSRDAGLCDGLREVLRGRPCPSEESFYRLQSAGVLAGQGPQDAHPRCGLYRVYLERHLL